MGHRTKHRHAALVRRVALGRTIKTDETPAGRVRYAAARGEADELIKHQHAEQTAKSIFAQALDKAQAVAK